MSTEVKQEVKTNFKQMHNIVSRLCSPRELRNTEEFYDEISKLENNLSNEEKKQMLDWVMFISKDHWPRRKDDLDKMFAITDEGEVLDFLSDENNFTGLNQDTCKVIFHFWKIAQLFV